MMCGGTQQDVHARPMRACGAASDISRTRPSFDKSGLIGFSVVLQYISRASLASCR